MQLSVSVSWSLEEAPFSLAWVTGQDPVTCGHGQGWGLGPQTPSTPSPESHRGVRRSISEESGLGERSKTLTVSSP